MSLVVRFPSRYVYPDIDEAIVVPLVFFQALFAQLLKTYFSEDIMLGDFRGLYTTPIHLLINQYISKLKPA